MKFGVRITKAQPAITAVDVGQDSIVIVSTPFKIAKLTRVACQKTRFTAKALVFSLLARYHIMGIYALSCDRVLSSFSLIERMIPGQVLYVAPCRRFTTAQLHRKASNTGMRLSVLKQHNQHEKVTDNPAGKKIGVRVQRNRPAFINSQKTMQLLPITMKHTVSSYIHTRFSGNTQCHVRVTQTSSLPLPRISGARIPKFSLLSMASTRTCSCPSPKL